MPNANEGTVMNLHPARIIDGANATQACQVPDWRSGSSRGSGKACDPEIERMLTAHIHCGEEMTLIVPEDPRHATTDDRAVAGPARRNGAGTYRCFCGFSFDQGRE